MPLYFLVSTHRGSGLSLDDEATSREAGKVPMHLTDNAVMVGEIHLVLLATLDLVAVEIQTLS